MKRARLHVALRLGACKRPENDTPAWASRPAYLYGLVRALGPYLTIELLLPGGSLIALLLWLHRRQYLPESGAGARII